MINGASKCFRCSVYKTTLNKMKNLLFALTITLLSCGGTKQPTKQNYVWYKEQISNQLITIEFNKKDSIKLITKN